MGRRIRRGQEKAGWCSMLAGSQEGGEGQDLRVRGSASWAKRVMDYQMLPLVPMPCPPNSNALPFKVSSLETVVMSSQTFTELPAFSLVAVSGVPASWG